MVRFYRNDLNLRGKWPNEFPGQLQNDLPFKAIQG